MYPSKPKIVKDPYTKLFALAKNFELLSSAQQLLEWDQETYMPHGAISVRAQQLELLASLIHKQKTSPSFTKALAKLVDLETGMILQQDLTLPQRAALREWRRDHLKMVKLPASFVKTFSKTTSTAIHAWAKAKKENDFRAFSPHLEKIVGLSQKKAEILGYREHPYDALLDLYEPEMTSAYLSPLFARLKTELTQLLKEIQAKPAMKDDFLHNNFPPTKQLDFSRILLQAMGFDSKTFRLDESNHPFCVGIHPTDTRMTTRLHPTYLMSNIFSTLHEGGHGLYNKNRNPGEFGSPLGDPISLSIDESQSRWWETRIGRTTPFWRYFFPILQDYFPEQLKTISFEDFYRAINTVQASFIRVEADEVTYSLHIIVRFEIEKALVEGTLKVRELPEAWNAKMQEYLGITPSNPAEGCLQDIHWSMGGIGYFPTYTLGNLYAAQFFETFEKQNPTWQEKVAKGELGFIERWLRDNIHQYGKQFTAADTVMRITGSPLSEKPFVDYLKKKYTRLYQLN
ncbi:MAG: carboxypeptidase M32 [Chlamydiales bacterium]